MDWITDPQAWIGFLTLTVLEIVLGVDNIVFISILAGKLPEHQRRYARFTGLLLAMISGRDLVLIVGGLFLVAKSTHEIHDKLEGHTGERSAKVAPSLRSVLIQILLLDMVFSLDSVITAVGMVKQLGVMVAAVIVAVAFMMFFAGAISRFVDRHPTVKMLALSFLLMIGVMLIADGLGHHIPKGYVYFAMAFSVLVESLNLRAGARHAEPAVKLHQPYTAEEESSV
jgi:predicted tellurium resistance membrane protein TerC